MLQTYLLVLLNLNHSLPRGHAADLSDVVLDTTGILTIIPTFDQVAAAEAALLA